MEKNLIMTLPEFIRSIKVNRYKKFMFFLGAGASISSGVPSVQQCIWQLKREIFLSEHSDIPEAQLNTSIKSNCEIIQNWLNSVGYPPINSEEEYSFYIEKCYPQPDDRKSFFFNLIDKSFPSHGYRLIPLLAEEKLIHAVWTTNFDALVSKAFKNSPLHIIEIGVDCQHRTNRNIDQREFACISLHGDYRYDKLVNTANEFIDQEKNLLANNEKSLLNDFVKSCNEGSLIVCGYSGRDKLIKESIIKAYTENNPNALYWCGYGENDLNENVKYILESVRSQGGRGFYIPTNGFDDLMCRMSKQCLSNELSEQAKVTLSDFDKDSQPQKPFSIPKGSITDLVKANAVYLELPQQCWSFELTEKPQKQFWKFCRNIVGDCYVSVIPFKDKFYGLGDYNTIKGLFENYGIDKLQTEAISPEEQKIKHGSLSHLLISALLKSLSYKHNLDTDSKRLLWERNTYTPKDKWDNIRTTYPCKKQVEVSIGCLKNKFFLILTPTVRICGKDGNELSPDIRKIEQNKVLGWQHNNIFNKDFEYWRKKLFGNGKLCEIHLPNTPEQKFTILSSAKPYYAGLSVIGRATLPNIKSLDNNNQGTVIEESKLIYNGHHGPEKCAHPIKGLVHFRPYSYSITSRLNKDGIKLGIITSNKDVKSFDSFIKNAEGPLEAPSKDDYLFNYPGFSQAFRVPLLIPQINSSRWELINESSNPKELAENICRASDSLKMQGVDVVLIFIPQRWGYPIRIESEYEYFDLHDFVKASCAQRGIVTQIITEKTFYIPGQQCRIWWWLSLAIYAKAGYTPWVLEGLSHDTAYVGLGYSIDRRQRKGEQIVLGCSHIYNAQGEGLSFRLSKLEDAWIEERTRNPYMSQEDARRVGESIIQLFFEQRSKMPKRVVIHKRTPFKKDEVDGICSAMHGIDNLELVEISQEHNFKFIASMYNFHKDKFDDYGYPIERGTLLPADDHMAFLWIHGRSSALGKKIYYQGKRRIPSPVCIKRHHGKGELTQLAIEILGLSKMDFNCMDLYGQMPCTINTANKIAQIGTLLHRYNNTTFDYRLFM